MEATNTIKEQDGVIFRHCSYCLNVGGLPIKLCGGCNKRAYCSKECLVKDWSSKGDGQRHVKWCRRHECGEEDVDWEVSPIPNKGLGIRAKKLIPAGLKIIVEPVFSSPKDHPGIEELGPEGDTLENKFDMNLFWGENLSDYKNQDDWKKVVALRIARVNHSCQPNAATIYDETACVVILFAQKDIQPGEEISVSYYPIFLFLIPPLLNDDFVGKSIEEELNIFKDRLAAQHGINCLANCYCNDPGFRALILEGRKLFMTVMTLAHRQHKIEEALDAGDKLLDIYRRLNVSWIYRGHTEHTLFHMAVRKSETLPRAKKYIRSAFELFHKICPYSERLTKKFETLIEHPETDPKYMMMDRDVANFVERLLSGLNL